MNPMLFGKPSAMMKRKRSIHQNELSGGKQDICDDNDREEDDELLVMSEYNDDSNSSLASSRSNSSTASSSTTCSLLKAQRIKHGHKIIITEERMNEAMQDLKIEIDNLETCPPIVSNVEQQDDTMIDDDEPGEGAILVSEELKARLKEYKMEDLLLNSHFKLPNKQQDTNAMQLVLWTPPIHHFAHSISYDSSASLDSDGDQDSDTSFSSTSSSSCSQTSKAYKVEEPFDIYKKNRLKRKFSQMNKLLIEEVRSNEQSMVDEKTVKQETEQTDQLCNFYLVDESDTTKNAKQDQMPPSKSSGFSIIELPIDEEQMEM